MDREQPANTVDFARPDITEERAKEVAEEYFGKIIGMAKELKSHGDRNFYLQEKDGNEKYVLKILHSKEELVTVTAAIVLLKKEGFVVPCPARGTNNSYIQHFSANGPDGETQHLNSVLLSYLEGDMLFDQTPLDSRTLFELGAILADLQGALRNLSSNCLNHTARSREWLLENIPAIKPYVQYLDTGEKRMLISDIISEFESVVSPHIDSLDKGIVHGDFHDENIVRLVSSEGVGDVVKDYKQKFGVIDFGDVCQTCYVFDLATSVSLFMISASVDSFIEYVVPFLSGYTSKRKLSDLELEVLYTSVCAGYCKELLLCEYHYVLQSTKNEYLLTSSGPGWEQLKKLRSLKRENVMKEWRSAFG